jgi:hypothetical protein
MNLILLIIPIVVIFVLLVSVGKSTRKSRNYSYNRRVWKIFIGYFILLLICVVIDAAIPSKGATALKKLDANKLAKETERLHDAALAGKIDQVDAKYKIKTWTFSYNGKRLDTAAKNNGDMDGLQVVVERKNSNDHQIEAAFYRTKVGLDDLDITEMIKPIGLELAGNQLIFVPEKSEINFTKFDNVFAINQFTGKSIFGHGYSLYEGQSILYLKLPKDLKLVTDDQANVEIEYVK